MLCAHHSNLVKKPSRPLLLPLSALAGLALIAGTKTAWSHKQDTSAQTEPISTGKRIAPQGQQTEVGSFPVNMALSPDGKFIAVTTTGFRQFLSILSADDGHLVSQMPFNPAANDRSDKTSLYYGLTFQSSNAEGYHLFVSRGPEDRISGVYVTPEGKLGGIVDTFQNPSSLTESETLRESEIAAHPNFVAGVAGGETAGCTLSTMRAARTTDFKGSVSIIDATTKRMLGKVVTPGFPLAIVAVTAGAEAGKKAYVSSEQDGCVAVLDVSDPANSKDIKDIKTGDHPTGLLLDREQKRLFVANASSDTVSLIDTGKDAVVRTWNVRGKSETARRKRPSAWPSAPMNRACTSRLPTRTP